MKVTIGFENYLIIVMFLIVTIQLPAAVRLPGILSGNMVIQRDRPFYVWGWANPKEAVSIKTSWDDFNYSTVAGDEGRWKVLINTPNVGGPYSIEIQGSNMLRLENVLCGDVWFCAGQSNMEMGMKIVNNGPEEIQKADYPDIRLFDVKKAESDTLLDNAEGQWALCSPQSLSKGDWEGFSAVAYYFGKKIYTELNIPVGLVDISWSATAIEPWIAPQGYASVEEVSNLYTNRMKADIHGAWGQPYRPSRIYNAMVAPLYPFQICGVIWYQGESNVGDGMQYFYKMKALITGWREVWNEGNFPFYFVQIAPYHDYKEGELAKLWKAQQKTLEITNTGMAKTEDIGDWNDIHPKNKKDVGERLANIALKNYYQK